MTLQEVKESYKKLIDSEKTKLSDLKRKIFRVGTLRLVVVLACIILCYCFWNNTLVIVVGIGISIIVFLLFLKYHNKLFIEKRYCELLIANAENELKGIEYDFSAFDGAPEKADASHSYSVDLDMFGNHSFFQSVNRTVTSSGKDRLADSLLDTYEKKEDILAQQEAIKELASKSELLNHFRAVGQMSEAEDLNIHFFSQQFIQTKLLAKSFWRYFTYIAPVTYIFLIALVASGFVSYSFIGLCWAVFFGLSLIPLKDIAAKMSLFEKKIDILRTYTQLFKIIEGEQFQSPLLKKITREIIR